jgi:tRNA threonylcarbamoyladenosine biosynthesis protein TsaE
MPNERSSPAVFITNSPEETIAFGKEIGRKLKAGDILAFFGELGSGKTTMIKGICLGLEVSDERTIKSPSFIIVNEYQGRYPIYHIDLYRINDATELKGLGLEEYLESRGVVLIEWAEKVTHLLPSNTVRVEIKILTETSRLISISNL